MKILDDEPFAIDADCMNMIRFDFDDTESTSYVCVGCGKFVSLDDSVSFLGAKLHCMKCVYQIAKANNIPPGRVTDEIQRRGKECQELFRNGVLLDEV